MSSHSPKESLTSLKKKSCCDVVVSKFVYRCMEFFYYRKKIILKEFPSAVLMLCGLHSVLTRHKVSR